MACYLSGMIAAKKQNINKLAIIPESSDWVSFATNTPQKKEAVT